jgi:protocatechuate 3,4-dioxygenase, beta subunit
MKVKRRNILQVLGLGSVSLISMSQARAACLLTPRQTEGPFYPEEPIAVDEDLTARPGSAQRARGTPLKLTGQVLDAQCQPVANALVEIWQADDNGVYKHSAASDPEDLDPNFQYSGKVNTDDQGKYGIKTIRPGKYPGRTPHIHFRVVLPDGQSLVTQLYFSDYPEWNLRDGIYQNLARRGLADRVTIQLTDNPDGGVLGQFDLTLAEVGTPRQ